MKFDKKNAKTSTIVIILVSICAVFSVLLAVVNSITSPIIAARSGNAQLAAYSEVSDGYEIVGQAHSVSDGGAVNLYYEMKQGNEKGYILNLTGKGYGGDFTIVASYKADGTLIAAKMLDNSETPGLGKKSEESWYMPIFTRTATIPTSKNSLSADDAALISGASVTFQGVANALNEGQAWVRSNLK